MKHLKAFTLIELIVLIAIGTLLSAVLLGSLSDAKEKVQAAACLSNLREIGMAISLYADDHADFYPPGYIAGYADWTLLICPYLAEKCRSNYSSGVINSNKVFICPSVQTPAGKTTRLTYSAHIALMGTLGLPAPFDGHTKRSKVMRPGELILVADGNLGGPAGAPSTSYDAFADFGMPMITPTQAYNPSAPDNDNSIPVQDVGPNMDYPGTPGSLGYIRWRHASNTAGSFLFCDGHAASMTISQVKRRNLRYDP